MRLPPRLRIREKHLLAADITAWWRRWPDANIGIHTGTSPTAHAEDHVIDLDSERATRTGALDGPEAS